jgi:hypothetical protein
MPDRRDGEAVSVIGVGVRMNQARKFAGREFQDFLTVAAMLGHILYAI